MARWTRFVLRFRWPILGFWLVVLLAGGFATSKLSPLLSNTFTVPGTDSERARTILQQHFGDRSDGEFLIVYKIFNGTAGVRLKLERSIREGATAVPNGKATGLRDAPGKFLRPVGPQIGTPICKWASSAARTLGKISPPVPGAKAEGQMRRQTAETQKLGKRAGKCQEQASRNCDDRLHG